MKRRLGYGIGVLGLLLACGGSDGDGVARAAGSRTLTILSPDHGAQVAPLVSVEVAETGVGELPPFELGVLVDGELVAQSPDRVLEVELPQGLVRLGVAGVLPDGSIADFVLGDEISVDVVTPNVGLKGQAHPGNVKALPRDFPAAPPR